MNPDRILTTEIRGAEAWDFLKGGKLRPCRKHNNSARNESYRCCIRYCAAVLYESGCQNLPYNVLLRRVLSNIDVIMSIKYLDEEDARFASVSTIVRLISKSILKNAQG